MKIGFFTDAYLPMLDGVATSVESCARALEERGHEVYIIAPKYPRYKDKQKNVYRLTSIKIIRTPEIRWALQLPEKSLRQIGRIDFDIIHGHGGGGVTFLGLQIARTQNIPYVSTYHTLWNQYTHYLFNGMVIRPKMVELTSKFFGNLCDALIAPTKRIEKELLSYGIKKPIFVLPSGIQTGNFTNVKNGFLRKKAKISEKTKILLHVGRLGKEKSVDFLIRSFKLIYKQDENTALVLLGNGQDKKELIELAKTLGVEKAVYFLGTVSHTDIPKAYADADLFVFASQTETQGMVILEAFASGLPIVAVKDEAFDGIIENGKNGYQVKKTPEIFAKKVDILLNNKKLYQSFADNGQKTAASFSVEKTAESLEELYRDLIRQKGQKVKKENINLRKITDIIQLITKARDQIKNYSRFPSL